MDASRFNGLVRSLSSVRSRRDLTRLLSGIVLSGSLALWQVSDAHAKRKKHKSRLTCNPLAGPGRVCDRCPHLCALPPL
jgi:hypothetical protein